ncbi:MAG: hypothetical protein IJL76_03775 [Bacilli bacterium]|nr:hypothetical protein [Bacilli bacterium]
MNNKVLIQLFVPEIDETFDLFIPVNELLWKIKKLVVKSVYDLTNGEIDPTKEYILINKITGEIYKDNVIIRDTNIRNATEIVLLLSK